MGIGGRPPPPPPRTCPPPSRSGPGGPPPLFPPLRPPPPFPRQPLFHPQLLRDRAHQRTCGAHRAHGRNVGCHQRHLARAQALRQRPDLARGVHALSALGAGILAALRWLGLPHHVAQRRLLVL